MHIFQNFNEVTSLALRLHQFVTLRKTKVTKNEGLLRMEEIEIIEQLAPCFVNTPG
jgi:hypothetical protein